VKIFVDLPRLREAGLRINVRGHDGLFDLQEPGRRAIAAESHAPLLSRLGADTARDWLLTQIWPIESVTPADEKKARKMILFYLEKSFSYTDATSFGLMVRLHVKEAFAFDPHFQQYGLKLLG
jgi:hypothetical protein